MLDIFLRLKALVKVSHVHIDSSVFRLHWCISSMILLTFSVIVTTRQYVGNPIDCIHTQDVPDDVFDLYCWIHSTYTIPRALSLRVGDEVAHPGVITSNVEEEDDKRYVSYYQWVGFTLFFQSILFYVPRWLWKNWEAGKITALMMDLDIGVVSEVEKKQKKKLLLDYLYDNLKNHNWWAYRYFFCELLACLNIIGQMFLMDRFFEGAFLTFGLEVMAFAERDQEDRLDPMIYVFPRMTKCTFHKFGASGDVEKHDALCILPLNIVNEKIYIFLWFWFLILGALSALVVLYRLVIIFSPRIRAYLLYIRFRLIKREVINVIVKKSKMGDWFLFYMLGQNVDNIIFKEVMHELARRLGHQGKDFSANSEP
ncbi:innexin shaking-B [Lepeophtheirus salmonis]|uniref:innexin shaking-B n=1 Tax=Lepeophtheirus salmonis TaxID=72036 RepID=UPI001AEB3B02|nr:innexin shaking-B-like [Lepeophtheirus salmonis]